MSVWGVASQEQVVSDGYRRARAVTRHHARSFYVASFALFGARRRAAFALYSFCRRLDDLIDGGEVGDARSLTLRLGTARQWVRSLYRPGPRPPLERLPWHPSELAALEDVLRRYRVPEEPFHELISGMEMDLTRTRYATVAELDLYCYRVAGVVGLMLAPVFGCRDERALAHAVDLGHAMQLTNILRDVPEDLARGRCYLPTQELARFGLTVETLAPGARFRAFLQPQLLRARQLYASGLVGIPSLEGFGARRTVGLMAALYSRILDDIEARGGDVFSGRAHLSAPRKLAVAARALVSPRWALPPALRTVGDARSALEGMAS